MIYLQLFYTFFKIGLFGFGGGYAMLSMIQRRSGNPLWMGEFAGVHGYCRNQPNDSRTYWYQRSYLCRVYFYG